MDFPFILMSPKMAFYLLPSRFCQRFCLILFEFCSFFGVFQPCKHVSWLNTGWIIEGGLLGMSRGSITWGIGVLAALLTQYKAPKMVPKSSSLGGKPVVSRLLMVH